MSVGSRDRIVKGKQINKYQLTRENITAKNSTRSHREFIPVAPQKADFAMFPHVQCDGYNVIQYTMPYESGKLKESEFPCNH